MWPGCHGAQRPSRTSRSPSLMPPRDAEQERERDVGGGVREHAGRVARPGCRAAGRRRGRCCRCRPRSWRSRGRTARASRKSPSTCSVTVSSSASASLRAGEERVRGRRRALLPDVDFVLLLQAIQRRERQVAGDEDTGHVVGRVAGWTGRCGSDARAGNTTPGAAARSTRSAAAAPLAVVLRAPVRDRRGQLDLLPAGEARGGGALGAGDARRLRVHGQGLALPHARQAPARRRGGHRQLLRRRSSRSWGRASSARCCGSCPANFKRDEDRLAEACALLPGRPPLLGVPRRVLVHRGRLRDPARVRRARSCTAITRSGRGSRWS